LASTVQLIKDHPAFLFLFLFGGIDIKTIKDIDKYTV